MRHLKKLTEEVIHTNPWWQYKHDTYEMPNGTVGDYYYGETNGMVMLVPVLEDGRIILTLQHRYLADKPSIEFPGGGISVGLDVREAAARELLEETGARAHEYIKVGEFQPLNGFIRDHAYVYIAHIQDVGAQQLDKTEQIELLLRRPEDIEEMIQRNDIWDGETMAAWSLVRHYFLASG